MLLSGLGFASLVCATLHGGSETRPVEVTQQDKSIIMLINRPLKERSPVVSASLKLQLHETNLFVTAAYM